MLTNAFGTFKHLLPPLAAQRWRSEVRAGVAAALIVSGALIFEAVTPQIISVGIFYVGLVLIGFWFSEPRASLILALIATPLIIVGYWITIPDKTSVWEAWLNRSLAIGTVWLTAAFVWRIRVLQQKLQLQIDIANTLSREIRHRIGNHLQLVASFLRLQAKNSSCEESRRVLELADSRVMVIGTIQRLLSHYDPSHVIDSKSFILALINDASAFFDPDKVHISVKVDSAEMNAVRAMALGGLLLELINNALKHAFPEGMRGMINVSFTASSDNYVVEFEDDGVGINRQTPDCFGAQNVAELARILGGSITCEPARQSNARPGTLWRVVIPN